MIKLTKKLLYWLPAIIKDELIASKINLEKFR